MQPQVQQWVLPSQGCLHLQGCLQRVAGAKARLGSRQQHTQEPMLTLLQGGELVLPLSPSKNLLPPRMQCLQDMAGFVALLFFFLNRSQKASKVAQKKPLPGGQLSLVLKNAKPYHKNHSKVVRKRGGCRGGREGARCHCPGAPGHQPQERGQATAGPLLSAPHGTTELEEKRPLASFCCILDFFFFLNH